MPDPTPDWFADVLANIVDLHCLVPAVDCFDGKLKLYAYCTTNDTDDSSGKKYTVRDNPQPLCTCRSGKDAGFL